MSYTGNGSNYDGNGILVRPKVEAQRPGEVPATAPARNEEASPTYVSPRAISTGKRGWMQPDNSTRERSNSSRSWSAPSNNSNNSFNNSSRSRSNSLSAPSDTVADLAPEAAPAATHGPTVLHAHHAEADDEDANLPADCSGGLDARSCGTAHSFRPKRN